MITLTKIAKLANVSVSTASKAFSMSLDISEETRSNIFKIAKDHGVFKKFYNAKYPRLVIAIVCPEFNNDLYANMLSDLQTRLEERMRRLRCGNSFFRGKRKGNTCVLF